MPLPAFLASLPNLETLDINSEQYDGAELSSVITEIIRVTKLKTIYQATVKGTNLDKLNRFANSVGVDIIWGERPLVWPVPFTSPE
jgi:F-box/TPR repeat protein Pof3